MILMKIVESCTLTVLTLKITLLLLLLLLDNKQVEEFKSITITFEQCADASSNSEKKSKICNL